MLKWGTTAWERNSLGNDMEKSKLLGDACPSPLQARAESLHRFLNICPCLIAKSQASPWVDGSLMESLLQSLLPRVSHHGSLAVVATCASWELPDLLCGRKSPVSAPWHQGHFLAPSLFPGHEVHLLQTGSILIQVLRKDMFMSF